MNLSKLLNITGIALLSACFALSIWRVFNRTVREHDPAVTIIRAGHFIQEDGFRRAFDALAADYMAMNPGVIVKQVVVPERLYTSWINTTIVGGQAPDLMLHASATHDFLLRDFESLNDIVEEPNPYNAGTKLAELPWRETFLDGLSGNPAYKPHLISYYGIPITSRTTRALYNKELLREITGSDDEPSTFNEFVALCENVQRYAERTARTLFPIAASGFRDTLLQRVFSSQTQRTMLKLDVVRPLQLVTDEIVIGYLNGKWSFTDEDLGLGLQLVQKIGSFAQPGFLQQTAQDALFYFSQGRALMMVAPSLQFHSIRKQTLFEIGVADIPLPSPDHPVYGKYLFGRLSEGGNVTDVAFGLTRQSKHPETAMDFLHFISGQNANQKFASLSGRLPAVVGVEPNPEMLPFMPVLSGYPRGYAADMPGRNPASLYRSNLYLLWSASAGIDAFLDVMNHEYEGAIVHEMGARLRLKGERVSNQDVWLTAHWAKRIKEFDFEDRWDRPRDPIHMMFESQTMHEGDRHWQRYTLIAKGFETIE